MTEPHVELTKDQAEMAKGHATVSAHEVVAVCTTLANTERFVKANPHPHCRILAVQCNTFYSYPPPAHQDPRAREGCTPEHQHPLMTDAP